MTGIYKITNPKGKIYIGQSVNIEYRFYMYRLLHCKRQPKLYNSLIKYGVKNHNFEILKECIVDDLNNQERYYQDYFNVVEKGLNCLLTKTNDKSGRVSFCTINKRIETMRLKRKINICTNENRLDLYTQTEYAKLIGKSTPWVNKLIRLKKIQSVVEINGATLIKNIN